MNGREFRNRGLQNTGIEEDYKPGRGFGAGRGFGRGLVGLKYWILVMTSKREMTGSEIIDALREYTMGSWMPSPGNIYPALRDLERLGFIKSRSENNRIFYAITEKGKTALESITWPISAYAGRLEPDKEKTDSAEAIGMINEGISFLEEHKENMNQKVIDQLKEIAKRIEGIIKNQ
ncbi:MAG: PadR family transcriptional regulator [Candidatus Micrarchaeia archaeon]